MARCVRCVAAASASQCGAQANTTHDVDAQLTVVTLWTREGLVPLRGVFKTGLWDARFD